MKINDYINPRINKYHNIDDLLKNKNQVRSPYDADEYLSTDKLIQEDFLCIVGAPGIGKSRLLQEFCESNKEAVCLIPASDFSAQSAPVDKEYCLIDALDEVGDDVFYSKLLSIKEYKEKNPSVKVLFSCRKHYVESYVDYFSSFQNLSFLELYRLRKEDVEKVIEKRCKKETKDNLDKNPKLKDLITIPRYLTFLLEFNKVGKGQTNIRGLFEYMIKRSVEEAIKASGVNSLNNDNMKILIQRVLEKVALILEISRKDKISKDELYSILDGIRGNMAQILVSNVNLLFLENRILNETNGKLRFENTELQEYLAAKELCRQDNIESFLYDVAVQKNLRHIYPNWLDVIPHISYIDDKVETFINIVKLIVSYESDLDNESFVSLVRYIDPLILSEQNKHELFSVLLDHYLRIPSYVGWRSTILNLMIECYSSSIKDKLKISIHQFNKMRVANISTILEGVARDNKLDVELFDYWTHEADNLFQDNNEEKKLAALTIFDAINARNSFFKLSAQYDKFSIKVREKYCEVTGYGKLANQAVADCWLSSCYEGNPYAINAVLNIEDPNTLFYVYSEIIKSNKLYEFFNPQGSISVFYDYNLKRQFEILWKHNHDSKIVITKVFAQYSDLDSFDSRHDFYAIIKRIFLDNDTAEIFIESIGDKWELASLLSKFETDFVDSQLLKVIEESLGKAKVDKKYIDIILRTLTDKIRKDENKKATALNYISRYSNTFEQWDKNAETEKKEDPLLSLAYQNLSDSNKSELEKYNIAYGLCKHIDFIKNKEPQPLVNVIETFMNELDLDDTKLTSDDSGKFSISFSLAAIPYYIKALYNLGYNTLLEKHREILAKTLPIACCTIAGNTKEIKTIYKLIIENLTEKEKQELVDWWKSRNDDFLNIRPDEVMSCITTYGIVPLSYKLEEYIKEYVDKPDSTDSYTAHKALELISQGYLDWKVEDYKKLFNALNKDDIESVKMLCNAIIIEKFQDTDAIKWRINYLKEHVTKSLRHEIGHVYAVSVEEVEMTDSSPFMFRCFMGIRGNEDLNIQMINLFVFALSLLNTSDTQEYASYLLKQIYLFFINTDNGQYIAELRRKIEQSYATRMSSLANNIMTSNEMVYLRKETISVDKAIKLYNRCIEESYLEIRNDGDLRRFFTSIYSEVQKEIQDQGIYSLVSQQLLKEDFIQRELKNTIITKCCQLGLNEIQVDREVALQDNKRTDILVRYGFCNPIMIELKLLHNQEIQNDKKRREYKHKFIQYTKATNACLSVFWVFNIDNSDENKFDCLKEEYNDLDNTLVLLTDCKCSSGNNTGVKTDYRKLRHNKR